jgi:hypothetical protein
MNEEGAELGPGELTKRSCNTRASAGIEPRLKFVSELKHRLVISRTDCNDRTVAITIASRFSTVPIAAQAKKGRRKMLSPTHTALHPQPPSRNGSQSIRRSDDVVYQVVTVAAILMVLGSLWIF